MRTPAQAKAGYFDEGVQVESDASFEEDSRLVDCDETFLGEGNDCHETAEMTRFEFEKEAVADVGF